MLGRIGKTGRTRAPHMLFVIRPAGRGAPRIDPKPILDGWKLLESTDIYRAGQEPVLRPRRRALDRPDPADSKETLARRVLADPRVEVYECGRRDIRAG